MRRGALAVVVAAFGCHTGKVEAEGGAPTGAPAPIVRADAGAPAAPDEVVITWLGPGQLEIVGAGSLASELRIERRGFDGQWSTLAQADPFRLRASCESPVPAQCTELVAGTALLPARWNGLTLNSQCGLGARGTSGDVGGRVRFVLSRCDGTRQWSSPELDVLADPALAERAWASQSILAARALRLDGPIANWQATSLPAPGKLMGLPVRAGTEHVLDDAQRQRLAALLADRSGYDDRIAKRCLMKHMIGFAVTRALPSSGATPRTQELEVVIDLSCHKIFIGRGDVAPRTLHGSHFDALRAGYLELVKSVFAVDRELGALR